MQNGFMQGMRATLPVSASVAAYGSVLGVLAAQKSVAWGTLMAMNVFIFAGSSQFVMIDMWNQPLPVLEMALAVLVINLRYLLAGASMQPLLYSTSRIRQFLAVHLVTDESWAVTMTALRRGEATVSYLVGAGLCVLCAWCAGTMVGMGFGAVVSSPEAFALDFAFTAVFTALAVSLWRGNEDALPWIVALAVSILAAEVLPGKWYIVIGAISGALTAAIGQPQEVAHAAQ